MYPVRTALAAYIIAWLITGPAAATDVLIDSSYDFWDIGRRDEGLSTACSMSAFNQQQMGRYTVQLHGKAGAAVLGVAKAGGFNLWDPGHLARYGEDYYFHHDGTTNCQVFVGGRTRSRRNRTPDRFDESTTP